MLIITNTAGLVVFFVLLDIKNMIFGMSSNDTMKHVKIKCQTSTRVLFFKENK